MPRISIVLDYSNRNLVIHGANSLGMPLQKFKDVLAVLGETDNDSGNEVGQFGMGHMSFAALSDNILFECFSIESGESTLIWATGRFTKGFQSQRVSLRPEQE